MTPFTEIKRRLDGTVVEFRCRLVHREAGHVVLRYDLIGQEGEVAGIWLPNGTVTFGYYWADRPYNVYHWLHPDGTTIAYYFNLADQTEIGEEAVAWRDLVVDIVITPDGRCQVLDEEELRADVGPAVRERIEQAKAEVLRDRARLTAAIERATRAL